MKGKSKMTTCKHCGKEIAKKAKVCPHCGGKNKKPIFKRKSFWGIIVVVIALIAVIMGSGNSYKLSDDASNLSESDYKATCETIAYKDLARDIEGNKGKKVKFTGEIQQVVLDSDSGESEYLVSVTKDEYGLYTNNIFLYYNTENLGTKLLEDDIIDIYGEVSNEYTYESILGESITIPSVTAAYVSIQE